MRTNEPLKEELIMLKKLRAVMRIKKLLVSLLLIAAILCAGCANSGVPIAKPTIDHPQYCDEILKALGKDVSSAVAQIGLTMDDFTYENGHYDLNESVDFLGYSFQMRLKVINNGDKLYLTGVYYILMEDTYESGAAATIDLRDKLKNGYGATYDAPKYLGGNYTQDEKKEKSSLENIEKATLIEKYTETKGGYMEGMQWLLSIDVENLLKEMPDDGFVNDKPSCIAAEFMTSNAIADEPEGMVLIRLFYGFSNAYVKTK